MKTFSAKGYVSVVFHAVVISLFSTVSANAWLRLPYTDPEIVQGAELIAVAHIKESSIVYVSHAANQSGGFSWEHHGTLIITEVLKGDSHSKEVPIIIHYGLDPVTGGYAKRERFMLNARGARPDYPADVIEIFDTGNSAVSMTPIADDIRKDHLWFLRIKQDDAKEYRGGDSNTDLGIWDPEDIQPMELKPYFQTFLDGNTEEKLKEYEVGNSVLAIRSRVYLRHLEMESILKEPDVNKRARLLQPFTLFTTQAGEGATQQEALRKIGKDCGWAGSAALVAIFNDSKYEAMQHEIMMVWSNTKYFDAIPLLTELVRKENDLWSKQTVTELAQWQNAKPTHDQMVSRNRLNGAIYVFSQLCDPTTEPLIEQTKALWTKLDPATVPNDITQICDMALTNIHQKSVKNG